MIFGPQLLHELLASASTSPPQTAPAPLAPTAGNELGNYTAYRDNVNFTFSDDYYAIYNDPATGRLWRHNQGFGEIFTSTDGGNTWSEEPFNGLSYPLESIPQLKWLQALNIEDLVIYDINNDGQDELIWSNTSRYLYYTSYPVTTSNVTAVENEILIGSNLVNLGWTFKLNNNWYSIKAGSGTNGLTGLYRNTDYKNNPNTWTHVIDYAASQGGSFPTEIDQQAVSHGGVASTSGTIILNLVPGSPYDNTYFRSTDDGATWTLLGNITGTRANFDIKKIATDNNDNWVLAGSGNKYYYSTNDGATWTQATPSYNPVGATNWNSNDVLYLNGKWLMIRENESAGGNDPSELISTSTPWISSSWILEENNFVSNITETRLRGMKPAGQNLILTGERGYFTYYKIPIIVNVINTSSNYTVLYGGYKDSNGTHIDTQSNEHTTPAESKRLRNLLTGQLAFGSGQPIGIGAYMDTTNLEVGTKLYGSSSHGNNPAYLYFTMSAFGDIRNTYAHYTINSDASMVYGTDPTPHANDYWVTVNTTTSTVEALYTYSEVTENTLKDVTCPFSSGGTVGVNGAFFLDGSGYSTYTDALNANISTGANGDTLYCDAENKYPKIGDRTYQTLTSTTSDSSNAYQRAWVPFLLEGTTSSGSVQYAVKFDYASYDGTNSSTAPSLTNSYFITEIRDSNGNSVTEIQDPPPPLITASVSAQLGYLVQNGTNGFLISTSSNHQTPTEAKRLYATSDSPDMAGSLYAYFSGTFQVGTVLYSSPSQATTFAGAYTAGYMTNDYAHFAVKADGGSWAGSDPSNFYWVTIQKSNSTVTAITENINVSANVLKDVGTNTSGLPNSSYGGFVLNNSAYNSYTTALAASLTSSQNLSVFYDGPGSYPKTHDRIYTASTGQQSFAATIPGGIGWHPFTTTGSSIDYAVQIGYASSSGTNSNTLPRANSTDLWISEIRDSNGNIVTQIT